MGSAGGEAKKHSRKCRPARRAWGVAVGNGRTLEKTVENVQKAGDAGVNKYKQQEMLEEIVHEHKQRMRETLQYSRRFR